MTLREWLTLICLFIGVGFTLLAAIGIIRMPDLFTRMSAVTQGTTFGAGFILVGSVIYFIEDTGVVIRVVSIIVFLLLTAPISAHMIGRAGYIDRKVQLWEGTKFDHLGSAEIYKTRPSSEFSD